jgi:hypothetical protein
MRVIDNCRPDRQTVMFSATFPRWVYLRESWVSSPRSCGSSTTAGPTARRLCSPPHFPGGFSLESWGFEPQVMRVIDNCWPDRQLVMFSATFPRWVYLIRVMGFESQVMRVIDNCRPDRQLVMFSVTFPRWVYLKSHGVRAPGHAGHRQLSARPPDGYVFFPPRFPGGFILESRASSPRTCVSSTTVGPTARLVCSLPYFPGGLS